MRTRELSQLHDTQVRLKDSVASARASLDGLTIRAPGVHEALQRMNIAHRGRHLPQQLSGGQQQRTAIARAVVARPKLILADEPTGNLDSATGEEVMQLLTELNSTGTTVVMVTHSRPHAQYAHRIVNLLDGEIVTENVRQIL